jgi:hypothetical protein
VVKGRWGYAQQEIPMLVDQSEGWPFLVQHSDLGTKQCRSDPLMINFFAEN